MIWSLTAMAPLPRTKVSSPVPPMTREVLRPNTKVSLPPPASKFSVPAPAFTSSPKALPRTVWTSLVEKVAASRWMPARAVPKSYRSPAPSGRNE